jgi:hypothetical protein
MWFSLPLMLMIERVKTGKVWRQLFVVLSIVYYVLSLAFPHSPQYFSASKRELSAALPKHGERVQHAAAFYDSPAESISTSGIRIVHVIDPTYARTADAEAMLIRIADQLQFHFSYAAKENHFVPWHPSIIIALRQLLI